MKIAVAPTVFIGLGGTGTTILQNLRQRLVQRVGTADLPFLRYLYVDTHQGSAEGASSGLTGLAERWSRSNVINPSPDTINAIRNPQLDDGRVQRRLKTHLWFDETARTQLNSVTYSQGVGGRRALSHLGFVTSINLPALRETLQGFHQELCNANTLRSKVLDGIEPAFLRLEAVNVSSEIRFVVVASSGGGSGSGCFIDLGYLLRLLRRTWDIGSGGLKVRQTGHVTLARSTQGGSAEERNTAALLTELDHYATGANGYEFNYITNRDGENIPKAFEPPYDAVYVTMPSQGVRPLADPDGKPFEALKWKLAEYLLFDTVAVYGDSVDDGNVKLPNQSAEGAVAWQADAAAQNPKGYWTFGVACREWPAALVTRELFATLKAQAGKALNTANAQVATAKTAQLCKQLGIPGADAQKNRLARDTRADQVLEALLAPVKGFDPVGQLNDCKERAYNEKRNVTSAGLVESVNAIKKQFESFHGEPVAGQPGITYAVLQTNADRLSSKTGDDSLVRNLSNGLLQLCTETGAGPATAELVAKNLEAAITAEKAFVEECLSTLQPPNVEKPARLEDCWDYANSLLVKQVLTHKKFLYEQLLTRVQKIRRRLTNFKDYLALWSGNTSSDALPSSTCPSIVKPAGEVQRIEDALKKTSTFDLTALARETTDRNGASRSGLVPMLTRLVDDDLPEKDSQGRPTLFAEGPPKVDGAPDFSYLSGLERALYAHISTAEGDLNPYNVEIIKLLNDMAAGGQKAPLIEEAEYLLHFNAAASDYANQQFGKERGSEVRYLRTTQEGAKQFTDQETAAVKQWLGPWGENVRRDRFSPDYWPSWTVGYVAERSSIVSRLIVGYDIEQRRLLLFSGSQGNPDWFNALTNTAIELPLAERALNEARMYLMGTAVLDLWHVLGQSEGRQFSYEWPDEQGRATEKKFNTKNDTERAVRQIAQAPDQLRQGMDMKIRDFLKNNRGAAATALNQATQAIDGRRDGKTDQGGHLPAYNLYDANLDRAIDGLYAFCDKFQIPLPTIGHRYAKYLSQGDSRPQGTPAPQSGYYCQSCGHLFGENMPSRTGFCPACQFPNNY